MSLLNDALRKKQKTRESSVPRGFFQKPAPASKRDRKKFVFVVFGLGLLGLSIAGIAYFYWKAPLGSQATANAATSDPPGAVTSSNETPTKEESPPKNNVPLNDLTNPPIKKAAPEPTPAKIVAKVPDTATTVNAADKPISQKKQTLSPRPKRKHRKVASVARHRQPVKKPSKSPRPSKEEQIFFNKAASYHRQGRIDLAIGMYQQLLQRNPTHEDALLNLASAYIQTAAYGEAHSVLHKLRHRQPNNADVWINLAIAEIGLGQGQSALEHLKRAEKLKPHSRFEICFHRAAAYSQINQPKQAIAWYQQAEGLQPQHPRLIFNMALVYDNLAQYPEAMQYYQQYLHAAESNPHPAERRAVEDRIRFLRTYLIAAQVQASKQNTTKP